MPEFKTLDDVDVRGLPGLNSLVFTALVTALLTAAFVLAAQKYLLGHLPG